MEAFTQLLKRLPTDTGMGFVLVQHLDPQHASSLTQILARATTMPVREASNNLRVEPNQVYIIPPNTSLGIAHGVLKLQPRSRHRIAPRSIDFFFEALAHDQHERAIGVILSGTATDGTLGLEAIKAEGGITFAQDDSAKYDSMPRSAIGAGCVDFVLAPEAIARELARIARHPYVATQGRGGEAALPARGHAPAAQADPPGRTGEHGYEKILLHLRQHSGVDFSLYKIPTIHRRIARRMVLNKQDTPARYANFLRGNARELDALYSDALINVTSFFRNPEAFAVLERKIFPQLLRQKTDDPLRVWVLGCSTGQEAYSLAMAFTAAAEKSRRPRKLQVFATDLNDANLEKARHGLYAKSITQDVSPERLRRFFTEEEGGYRVIKPLRELVVFARQNLISDPPFSRMDLISCRNLMIYLEPSLQKKVFPTFHYALKPEGFLFLGSSESIGTFTDLFAPMDKKQKIYAKKSAPTTAFHLPVKRTRDDRTAATAAPRAALALTRAPGAAADAYRTELNAEREADRVTVNQFAPPGVLITSGLQVLQFRGPTGAYLEPPSGKASFDVLKMAREGLMLPLRTTINRARKENKTARTENVPVAQNGQTRRVNLEVVPLKNLKERCFLVLFEDAEKGGRAATTPADGPREVPRPVSRREESRRIAELERDLAETRDYLQSVEEQQEAANEELQAANEEGQSANEELQSLNEELETSKEELESTNEELTTVNEEMVNRNAELNRLNSDLTNLSASTKLVIVLLGRDLTIRRFSAQAEKQFHLHASDLGRPLSHIRHDLDLTDLDALIAGVINSVREIEREVRDRAGRWYSLHVRPYLSVDNKVDGAVLVLVDISAIKESQHAVSHARDFAEAIIDTVRDPFLILDADLRVQKANPAFSTAFRIAPEKLMGRSLLELDRGQWADPGLRKRLQAILPRDTPFNDFELTLTLEQGGHRTLLLNARKLSQAPGHREKILLGIEDVTAALALESDLRRSEKRYRRLFEAAKDGILILDPGTRKITDANPFISEFLGYTRRQLVGKELWQIGLLKDEASSRQAFRALKRNGFIRYEDLPLKTQTGQRREVEFVSNLYRENGHDVIQCNIRDITERKRVEVDLSRLAAIVTSSSDAIIGKDLNSLVTSWNTGAEALFGYTAKEMMGSPISRLIPAARQFEEGKIMARIKRGHSVEHFETVRVAKDGRQLEMSVTISPIRDAGGEIVGASKVARDITGQKQAEAALRNSERRYRSLFNSIDEGFCILEMIFDQRGRPADFRYLEVNPAFERQSGIRGGRGKRILEIAPNFERHWLETYGKVIRTGKPVRFTDESKALNRWFDVYAFRFGGKGSSKIAVLFSNITARKRVEAALSAARNKLSDHATQLEQMVTLRTAQLTATNRRLRASVDSISQGREQYRSLLKESDFMQLKLRQLTRQFLTAQEDERREISRELHDEVVQTLVGITVELAALSHASEAGRGVLKSRIARTQRLVEKSVTAVHRFARELRPAALDDLGLLPAIRTFVKGAARLKNLKVDLIADAAVEALDMDRRTVLFRVAQEALNNVARHAQATAVRLSIEKIPGAFRMEVRDNGKSFQVLQTLSARTNKRLGLLGMRERVEMVGGTLLVLSAPGEGTTVRAEVPSLLPPSPTARSEKN